MTFPNAPDWFNELHYNTKKDIYGELERLKWAGRARIFDKIYQCEFNGETEDSEYVMLEREQVGEILSWWEKESNCELTVRSYRKLGSTNPGVRGSFNIFGKHFFKKF